MLFPPHIAYLRRLRLRIGKAGEKAARRYLENCGYDCLLCNWRPPHGGGEVDLITLERGGVLCFVEVKTRRLKRGQSPLEVAPRLAVDEAKRRHLSYCAEVYLRHSGHLRVPFRFDVIEVWSRGVHPVWLRHWPGAFSAKAFPQNFEV